MAPTVVITGASTGIGRACALRLDRLGWRVVAGVRRGADIDSLKAEASERFEGVLLDITNEASVDEMAAALRNTPLAGLVNNAGIVVAGPVELVPLSDWRRQFEVNVFGTLAVTRALLPQIRLGHGRIVNMGSIAGRSVTPISGPYSASKFALEAITDALRMELKPWKIEVSIIEPGAVQTPIWDKSRAEAETAMGRIDPERLKLYTPLIENIKRVIAKVSAGAISVDSVVTAVEHALTANHPRTRYVVGREAKLRMFMNQMPDRTRDRLILSQIEKMS